ncbi:TonB-dependent receptor [Fulvivirga sp.]|uniref:TonB-dependent receptor plug domain-containing protein n=1 Tax=Fulvivirga sp. TaxID=1931237 RepID=UPI0032EF7E52
MKEKITLLLLIISTGLVQAQVTITIVDIDTELPVEGVQIKVENKHHQSQLLITDDAGVAVTTLEPPLSLSVTHVSYQSWQQSKITESTTLKLLPSTILLEEMVVTGQYSPQSAKNAVYKIRNISKERIQAQGATNVQEILSNELNIRFGRDNALGTSGISLQGISGQNVKVLIDGVPVTGRSGVANEIDINQININSIDRIEIVEGPMAVNFGADALAGVINLITKKGDNHTLSAALTLQEESVEREFEYFDEGIHNAQLNISGAITDRISGQLEGRVNTFGGWIGDPDTYTDRNRQWYPKQQYFGSGVLHYDYKNFSLHYRGDYLNETIQNFGAINNSDPNSEPYSSDQEFISNRFMHQLQGEGNLGKWFLHPVVSFSDYERVTENFTTYVDSDLEFGRNEVNNTAYKTLFFRNTASYSEFKWGSIQLGAESTIEKGSGSSLSFGNKYSEDFYVFASSEIRVLPNLYLRPGVRYGYHNLYDVQPAPSVNVKYDITDKTQLRLGYGRGYRVPSLRELYHEFIDANHNILGNPLLTSEYSHNANLDITRQFDDNVSLSLSGFYNNITDRITFFTPQESNGATTYLNLDKFKSTGTKANLSLKIANIRLNVGASYVGRYQLLDEEVDVPGFVFNWEANTNATYTVPQSKTSISVFYKYNGPLEDYRLVDLDGDGEFTPELQGIEGYHWLDLTITQPIGKHFTVGTGAKNLFDITAIDNNFSSGGGHGGSSGSTSVGYGRSYFLRINYQLNIKNK